MCTATTKLSLICSAAVLTLTFGSAPDSTPAQAACPGTIVNGETVVVTQNLANGQNCTVDQGGVVDVDGDNTSDNASSVWTLVL